MDILGDKGTQATTTQLATELTDLAALWRQELNASQQSQIQSSHAVRATADVGDALQKALSTTDDTQVPITPDLQFILDRAHASEWKDDGVVQERAGLWALYVASARTGLSPEALRAGFKDKALQALGRLALQLLSSTSAKQLNTVHSSRLGTEQTFVKGSAVGTRSAHQLASTQRLRNDLSTQQRAAESPPTQTRVAVALQDVGAFFQTDATQVDLQTIQSGLDLDTTADEVFDAFVETLRDDGLDIDSASSRMDACNGVSRAAEEHDVRRRNERQESRRSAPDAQLVQARTSSGHTVRFRDDVDGIMKADAGEHRHARASAPVPFGRARTSFSKAPSHSVSFSASQESSQTQRRETVKEF